MKNGAEGRMRIHPSGAEVETPTSSDWKTTRKTRKTRKTRNTATPMPTDYP
jgi:hypothetical protein